VWAIWGEMCTWCDAEMLAWLGVYLSVGIDGVEAAGVRVVASTLSH
jgi:hypothetical protein